MRIFKSSIVKKILWVVLIMWCSWIFLNWYVGVGEATHAADDQGVQNNNLNPSTNSLSTIGLWQIMDMVLKLIYLLLRPLLVVAGLALDNTLVYASVFHLDAPLWKFRNMMKNFANFTLWFMVLFAIIKSILTNSWEWSLKDEKSPLGIIKITLIAGILIQASWFLLAALVDVSTIATYAVGWLPLSVLKNTTIGNKKILSVNSSIDLNKFDVLSTQWENFKVWYSTNYQDGNTTKKVELSPCRIESWYVVGRQYGDPKYLNSDVFWKNNDNMNACVLFWNQIVLFHELPMTAMQNDDVSYQAMLNRVIGENMNPDWTFLEWCNFFVRINWPSSGLNNFTCNTAALTTYKNGIVSTDSKDSFQWYIGSGFNFISSYNATNERTAKTIGIAWWTTWFESGNVLAMTTSDLIKKSKWFVGPLVTIYSSLLNFAQLTDSNITTIWETSGVFLIKAWVAIALFFPLIALALVLIARIGILRLYIVASPFIVIKESFKNFIKLGKLDEYLSLKSIIGIVFAPVVTVAALSISLIFMTALVNWFQSTSNRAEIQQTFGTQQIEPIITGNDAISLNGVAQIEFTKLPWWEAMDRFSRLMVNFFAIGLMRMIFFAALKSAKPLGEKIGGQVQTIWQNVFRTLPILPIGEGGKWVGIGSAAKVISNVPERFVNQLETTQQTQVKEWLYPETAAGGTTFTATQATKIVTEMWGWAWAPAAYEVATTENIQTMYKAINDLYTTEEERMKAAEKVAPVFGLTGSERYKKIISDEKIAIAKTPIDTYITSKKPTTKVDLEGFFNTAKDTDKTNIVAYFTATGTNWTYETTTSDGKKYTIKQIQDATDKTKFTYTATEITS